MLTELPRLRFYYFFVAVILISSRIFAATQVYDVSQVQVIRGEGLSTMEFGVSSPDGKHFYASLFGLSGIAVFDHTQSALTLKHVYRSGSEGISNLQSPGEMVFNAAGTIPNPAGFHATWHFPPMVSSCLYSMRFLAYQPMK